MIQFTKKIYKSIIIFTLFFSASSLLAQVGSTGGVKNPLNVNSITDLVKALAQVALEIAFPIAVLAIVYAGFLFVTAGGDESKLKSAKQTFWYAVIGTALILGAQAIIAVVKTTIEGLGN